MTNLDSMDLLTELTEAEAAELNGGLRCYYRMVRVCFRYWYGIRCFWQRRVVCF
ncbi:MAG: hypothetical protein ACFCVD_10605 [Nodosilinea sp.]